MSDRWLLFKRGLADFWKVFSRHKPGMLGAVLLASSLILAVFAPWLTGPGVKETIRDFLSDREPGLLDFTVDPTENCYPMVPPGASIAEMVVEPPRALIEEEVLDDLWAVS